MISRKVALTSAFCLFLSGAAFADAPPTNNFAKKQPAKNEAPSEMLRTAPVVKNDKVIIIRNGAPVGFINDQGANAPAGVAVPTGCRNDGLANIGTAPLQFVHVPLPTGWGGFPNERFIDNVQGKASYGGQTFDLKVVTVFKRDFRPFSGVSFPMHIRFDYVAEDKSHVTVDVPVREGAANMELEKILSVQNALIDPEGLFPQAKQYTVAAHCVVMGAKMNELVMTTPIEASPAQIERFAQGS